MRAHGRSATVGGGQRRLCGAFVPIYSATAKTMYLGVSMVSEYMRIYDQQFCGSAQAFARARNGHRNRAGGWRLLFPRLRIRG